MNIEDIVYDSYVKAKPYVREKRDMYVRKPEFARFILQQLGLLEDPLPTILVTGSKGKGSVSRMIAFLLQQAGYKVGHFSSPHLLEFSERIRVNGKAISEEDLHRLGLSLQPIIANMPVQHELGEYIGPIAISQAIALRYFKEQNVDVAVMEAGRGGRFDDTNQIPHKMAVITPIMEEHLDQLGPSIQDVVWHKLGIVTNEVEKVFIARQREDVLPYVQELIHCQRSALKTYFYDQHFTAHDIEVSLEGTKAWIESNEKKRSITLPLLGAFQAENFALAYTVANVWSAGKLHSLQNMHIDQLRWPGRCEVLEQNPLVLLDGGVHRTSASDIRRLISQIPHDRLYVLLSIPKDKDMAGVVEVFQNADALYTTTTTNPYLQYEMDYEPLFKKYHINGTHIQNVSQAFHTVRAQLRAGDIFLCMGTQSFVGDILRMYGKSIRDL